MMGQVLSRLVFLVFSALLLVACGSSNSSNGSGGTGGTGGSQSSSVTSLGITATQESVSTDGIDSSTLTIRALGTGNAVVANEVITLSATAGALSASTVTTGTDGKATVTFDSGVETANQVATVTASVSGLVATKSISIIGTSVSFTASKSSVGLNGASSSTLTVIVLDGSSDPVGGETVTLTASLGQLVDASAPGTPASTVTLTTNSSGVATATYTGGSTAGTDTITLTGPATDSLNINISGSQFALSDSLNQQLDILLTDTLTLTWIDAVGNPVSGQSVQFSTNNGTFDATGNPFVNKTTDVNGQASTVLTAGTTGMANVTVRDQANTLSDTLAINVVSLVPNALTVEINPAVLDPSSGGSVPSAVVTATVRDASNRAVQGVDVAFSLTSGPGGGEFVSPGIAATNSAGIATVNVFSGGLTSAQDGVTVRAQVVSNPSILDTETFTIANQAASVQIGTTNKIAAVTIGGAEAAYALPFTVLVTDINGGAIAGQNVSLSLFPVAYLTGTYADSASSGSQSITNTFANEDLNRNGILDAGEDGSNGSTPNGKLDPGNIASIPSIVTTDQNGFAGFDITYAKSFGNWTVVEIQASTNVSGTESTSVLVEGLAVMEDDTPFIDSPFGP